MNTAILTRTAAVGTGAVLCLGISAPAMAHTDPGAGGPHRGASATLPTPTLAQERAWIDQFVAHRQQSLDRFAARVASDPDLTAAQQATVAARVAQARAALDRLKTKVDAATSTDQVHAIVKAAFAAMPQPMWPLWHPRAHRGKTPLPSKTTSATKATDASVRTATQARQVTVHHSLPAQTYRGHHRSPGGEGFGQAAHQGGHHHHGGDHHGGGGGRNG